MNATPVIDATEHENLASSNPLLDTIPHFVDLVPESLKPIWMILDQTPILAGFAIILFFSVIAFLARFILTLFLKRFAQSADEGIRDRLVEGLRRPMFITIVLLGFILGTKTAQFSVGFTTFSVNLLASLIIASWMRATFILSGNILTALTKARHTSKFIEPRTAPLIDLLNKLIILLLGSYSLLIVWGINPVGWLASAGIVGIAVGFAAKDTLANLFSGFFILIDSPYKIGDYVNLDSGERGCVTHIGLRSTRILSRDDIEITLPNAMIANSKIVNESGGARPHIRTTIPVGVAYGSDTDTVCSVLQNIAEQHPEIVSDPAPRVRMRGFGASSLNFELLGWIEKPEDRGRIRHELLLQIDKQFRANNIEIPYAKSDLYIKQLPVQPSKENGLG